MKGNHQGSITNPLVEFVLSGAKVLPSADRPSVCFHSQDADTTAKQLQEREQKVEDEVLRFSVSHA